MSMFRVCKDKDNPYVMLNKEFLLDPKLSAKAKGILAYLLSLPDDWQIFVKELVAHFKDGKDSINAGINELIKEGYITRVRTRDEKGMMKAYEYCVYEVPTYNGKSNLGESNLGKPATTNNNLTNNNLTNIYGANKILTTQLSPFSIRILSKYLTKYFYFKGRVSHPKIDNKQFANIDYFIIATTKEYLFDEDAWETLMDKHFRTSYPQGCDYKAQHFFTEGIVRNRHFETLY